MGKEKNKHKKKSKSNKHKKYKSSKHKDSSDGSSSSEGEWIERFFSPHSTPQEKINPEKSKQKSEHGCNNEENELLKQISSSSSTPLIQQPLEDVKINPERHDWMSNPDELFACVSRKEIRSSKEKKKDNEDDKYMLDKLGQTERELNPYWKDGGSGLPAESHLAVDSLRQASVTVGDQGTAWLRKALQRAKEQSVEERRSLQEVVAERWGSLEKLESMIAAAEERDKTFGRKSHEKKDTCRQEDNKSKDRLNDKRYIKEKETVQNNINDEYRKKPKSTNSKKSFAKPDSSDDGSSDLDKKYKHSSKLCLNTSSFMYDNNRGYENKKGNIYDTYNRPKYSKREGKYSSKSYNYSDDSSSVEEDRRYRKHSNSSKKKTSKRILSNSSDSKSEGEKRSPKKYGKDRNSNKRFAKPSVSSSEDEGRSHQSNRTNKYDREKIEKLQKENKNDYRTFLKPYNDSKGNSFSEFDRSRFENYKGYSSSGRGWRKNTEPEEKVLKTKCDQKLELEVSEQANMNEKNGPIVDEEESAVLTDKEMNELGAKLVKAEILGNHELAKELKAKLDRARETNKTKAGKADISEEVVILTHTDSKGFTRPVGPEGPSESSGGRRKAKKVETHSGGKRIRYFADDDKYSLQEMFQREKLSTVEDSNEVFAKLASKGVGRDGSARDMEDVFEETACVEEVVGKKQARERQNAIEQSKKTARSLENCQWCLESKQMLKHLIIAIGNTCYLCVPPHQSLTENHCLIVPTHHTPCGTQLDENVWREMQDFRKSIVQMFVSQNEDVVFFESAQYLNRFPHMILNCVPMPKETGDLAPIYFKKAIQECEMEWSNNKKLVDLRGRDVRRAVPKGLPYFAVDFGTESGFAHVIEDEKLFPQNFAQEIIGGMLDLDHTIWRKHRKQTFEEQSKKVIQLAKLWSGFDITKKNEPTD